MLVDEVKLGLPALSETLGKLRDSLDIDETIEKLKDLEIEVSLEGFWDDLERAQKTTRQKASLEKQLKEWTDCQDEIEEIKLLCQMADEEGDEEFGNEAIERYQKLEKDLEIIRLRTFLTGEYDSNNAIISIHPGAGGTEAKDWAQMLLRMYLRWAEQNGYKATILDLQDGAEAGIDSADVIIEGDNAYGFLKNERGVHRLVRISPFNAQGKRQTSFASVDVTPEIDGNIEVEINPEDLRIDTYRSSGAGGQHVNKTDSAVRITHLPTGIVVSCQNERSQIQNKAFAMKVLYAKLFALAKQEHKDKISDLKGNFAQIAWGSQIRSYVFQPYTMVKDHRTGAEVGNVQAVMNGDLETFIWKSLSTEEKTS
ncbi:MAG: peptide chain release factor 2 [Clostridia bacterium]|nr:peptide chain release factor 2 [Clostridia bacterium]